MAAMTMLLKSCCQNSAAGEDLDVVVEGPGVGKPGRVVADRAGGPEAAQERVADGHDDGDRDSEEHDPADDVARRAARTRSSARVRVGEPVVEVGLVLVAIAQPPPRVTAPSVSRRMTKRR